MPKRQLMGKNLTLKFEKLGNAMLRKTQNTKTFEQKICSYVNFALTFAVKMFLPDPRSTGIKLPYDELISADNWFIKH